MQGRCGGAIETALAVLLAALAGAVSLLFTVTMLEAGGIRLLVVQTTAAGLVIALLVLGLIRGRVEVPWRPATLAGLVLGGYVSVRAWAIGPAAAMEWWRVLMLLALALATARLVTTRFRRGMLLGALAVAASVVAVYAFAQRLGYRPITWSASSRDRVFSTVGNPNMFAAYCVMLSPLLLLGAMGLRSRLARMLVASVGVMLVLSLVLTKSRGGMLGLAAAGLAAGLVYRRELLASRRRVLAAAGVLLVLVGLIGAVTVSRWDDWRSLGRVERGSGNVRLVIWQGAWRMFRAQPWLGVGPGQFSVRFPEYRSPDYETYGVTHNTLNAESEPLEVLTELGLVGFLAWAVALGIVLVYGYRQCRAATGFDRHLLAGTVVGLFALLMHNLVCVNLRWPDAATHLAVGLGLILGYGSGPVLTLSGWRRWLALAAVLVVSGLLVLGCRRYSWHWYRSEQLTMTGDQANQRGQWATATTALQAALVLNPGNVRACYFLGYTYFQLQDFSRAIAIYRQLQQTSPNYCQIHYNLAACHLNLSQWPDAAREYALQRRLGGLPAGLQFEALLSLLQSDRAQEDKYRQALEYLVAMDPNEIQARNMLGNCLYRRGDVAGAKVHYEAILRLVPNHIAALNNLAGVAFAQGDHARARDMCLRLLALTPHEVTPQINLGKAYYMLGQLPEARATWVQARAQAPERADIDEFLALVPTPPAPEPRERRPSARQSPVPVPLLTP